MKKILFSILVFSFASFCCAQSKVIEIDPNKVQYNGYVHETLPSALLKRIKATTDTFEIVDGVSYEKAVDLYRRDIDPESNLVIFEEMARVYKLYCKDKCSSAAERMDVYSVLLLRSMFNPEQTLAHFQPKAISMSDAKNIISQYELEAKPIEVMQK
jgi:hypothetical protein